MSASTRAAEGFFNGLKFTLIHALTYAPYWTKAICIEQGLPFWPQYVKKVLKSSFFYCGILSATFGMRHLVAENKDRLTFDLQYNVPLFQKSKVATDIVLYCCFCWPIGFAVNHLHTGRYLRGGLSMTLMGALVVRAMDAGQGLATS